jgi:predicted secreted Zn-dependent protease
MRYHALFYCCVLLSFPVAAEVTAAISYKTYAVDHKAGTPILRALNNASPIRENGEIFHGYTSWNIKWRFWWNQEPNGRCSFTRINTSLTSVITLPELVSSDQRASIVFSNYLDSLRQHELGHVEIARATARKIDDTIMTLPPMDSCPLLEQTANRLGQQLLEQARQEEQSYDRVTRHGRTQGAYMDQ